MKFITRLGIIVLLLVTAAGCTYPWRENPDTGEIPLVSGFMDAVGPALQGNYPRAIINLVIGTIIGCFATKKRKDGQMRQVVRGVEHHKDAPPPEFPEDVEPEQVWEAAKEDLLTKLSKSMDKPVKRVVTKLREQM